MPAANGISSWVWLQEQIWGGHFQDLKQKHLMHISRSIRLHVRIKSGIEKFGIFLKFCFVPNLASGKDAQCSVMVTSNRVERHFSACSLSSVVSSFLPKTITRLCKSFDHSHNDSLNVGLSPYQWNICTKSNATQCWTKTLKNLAALYWRRWV